MIGKSIKQLNAFISLRFWPFISLQSFVMQDQPFCSIFLLVNSTSGGGIGKSIVSQEMQKIQFDISITKNEPAVNVHIFFYDLFTRREKAFKMMKQLIGKKRKVICVICGGDGTIMWVVSQMFNYQIDPLKVPITVLPLGTGNDFSQYLGWGKQKTAVMENKFAHLKKLIKKWLAASEQEFDIWDVIAQVQQKGKFQKVNKHSKSELIEGKILKKSFCNYFSFGLDGKIGYSFDKRRTTSRIGNLVVYGTMGLIKGASKTKTLKQLVQKMEVKPQLGQQHIQPQQTLEPPLEGIKSSLDNSKPKQVEKKQQQIIFSSIKGEEKDISLNSDYYNLLFLNIDSFMGGVKDIWNKAGQKQFSKNQVGHEISSGDGEIQVLAFSSTIGMAFQRIIGGFAQKIAQGSGPFYLTFKEYEVDKHRTYLQIDGQFIRFSHPKSLLIRKSYLSPSGKIKILRRNISKQNFQ